MSPSSDATPLPQQEAFERARQSFLGGLEQLAQGRLQEAEQSFLASLALLPGRVSTLVNLAAVRVRLGRPADALEAADQVLKLEPNDPDAWLHRAEALAQMARHEEALESFRQAGESGRKALPWYRHGQVLQDLQRDEEALQSYERAVAIDPAFAPAWTNQGNILRERSRIAEAQQAFRQAIAHGGQDALHAYYLASVSPDGAQAAPMAPSQYIEGLFDTYAEGFDHHVVDVLGYRAPEVLASRIGALAPGRRFRHALDLGCGTGLCGLQLKAWSERLTGVDLSSQMLAKAQATGCYQALVHQEVAEFLHATDTRHDLVVAADVFIYVGDLARVFTGLRRVLDDGGLFSFSVEALPDDAAAGFALRSTLRYAHSQRYVRALAADNGFEVVEVLGAPLRQDQRQPIDGLFFVLRKGAA